MRSNTMRKAEYTSTAKFFHWLSALLIIYQLSSGIWMTRAIQIADLKMLAWKTYQTHKSVGISILILTMIRFIWRQYHRPPDHSKSLSTWEITAALIVHRCMYLLAILSPMLGWLMVSASPLRLPTVIFGLFSLPHLPSIPVSTELYIISKQLHIYSNTLLFILMCIHISAAIKHHIYDKNNILISMLPKWPKIK